MSIQTTIHDVVFRGHGGVDIPPVVATKVPPGVEFWLLAPPGAGILNHLATMLETGERIEGLYIHNEHGRSHQDHTPQIYPHGAELPDLILEHTYDIVMTRSIVPHIVTVNQQEHLQNLWHRIDPHRTEALKKARLLRVFWGACSDLTNQTKGWLVGASNHPEARYTRGR